MRPMQNEHWKAEQRILSTAIYLISCTSWHMPTHAFRMYFSAAKVVALMEANCFCCASRVLVFHALHSCVISLRCRWSARQSATPACLSSMILCCCMHSSQDLSTLLLSCA